MKKTLVFIFCLTVLIGCKTESKSSVTETTTAQDDNLTVLKGDFVYFADAAVLQTPDQIYGVVLNQKMHELAEQVKPLKTADTDMVTVKIKGNIIPKPEGEEGWPLRVEIKEIIKVSKPTAENNNVIKLGKE